MNYIFLLILSYSTAALETVKNETETTKINYEELTTDTFDSMLNIVTAVYCYKSNIVELIKDTFQPPSNEKNQPAKQSSFLLSAIFFNMLTQTLGSQDTKKKQLLLEDMGNSLKNHLSGGDSKDGSSSLAQKTVDPVTSKEINEIAEAAVKSVKKFVPKIKECKGKNDKNSQ